MTPTVFPYVIEVLYEYLNGDVPQQLLGCETFSQLPNPRPVRYVELIAAQSGGLQQTILTVRRVIFQWDGASLFDAGQLGETLRGLVVDAKYQGLGIKRVNVIGEPGRFAIAGQPYRHQMTADFTVRAKASVL